MEKLYLFVDTETTGKNFNKEKYRENKLLSIGYVLTDKNLKPIKQNNFIVHHDKNIANEMNDYVFKMHTNTGLIQKCIESKNSLEFVEKSMFVDLEPYADAHTIIPAGNNIQFDVEVIRRNLPTIFNLFHYSFLDVTSARKVLAMIYPQEVQQIKDSKKLNHNSDIDCWDSLHELKKLRALISPENTEIIKVTFDNSDIYEDW